MSFGELILLAALLYFSLAVLLRVGLKRRYPKKTFNPPSVSVIVSARNEARHIQKCLSSLARLDYPEDKLEIVLVNDRSEDETHRFISEFINGKARFKYLINEANCSSLSGKANAISLAIAASKGEFIFITDADCEVAQDWLTRMVVYFTDQVGLVAGFARLQTDDSFFAKLQNIDWLYLLTVAAGAAGWHVPLSCIGNNFAIRRSVYQQIGGYSQVGFSVTEDFALLKKIAYDTNWEIVFPLEAGALVVSQPVPGWREFFRQRKRWAIGGRNVHWFGKLLIATSFLVQTLILISLTLIVNLSAGLIGLAIIFVSDLLLLRVPFRKMDIAGGWWLVLIYRFFSFFYMMVLGISLLFNQTVVWKGEKYCPGKKDKTDCSR